MVQWLQSNSRILGLEWLTRHERKSCWAAASDQWPLSNLLSCPFLSFCSDSKNFLLNFYYWWKEKQGRNMLRDNCCQLHLTLHWQHTKSSVALGNRHFYQSDLVFSDKPSSSYGEKLMFLPGSLHYKASKEMHFAWAVSGILSQKVHELSTWTTTKTLISHKLAKTKKVNCLGTDNLVQKTFWIRRTGCIAN